MNGRSKSSIPTKAKVALPWVAKITAITGLVAALTPGLLAWESNRDDDKKNSESKAAAVEAGVKAEIAYELLKQKLEFLEKEQAEARADLKDLRMVMRDVFMNMERVRARGSRRAPRSVSRGSSRGFSGESSVSEEESMMKALEPESESNVPAQKTLPNALDNLVEQRMQVKK